MHRHTRAHFIAFGLLPLINTVVLLIYGLHLSTRGSGNTGRSLVIILAAGVVMLSCAAVSAVKRGRDLGHETLPAVLLLAASLIVSPLLPFLFMYLCFARSKPLDSTSAEQRTDRMGFRWLWAPVLLISPWMALLVASALP